MSRIPSPNLVERMDPPLSAYLSSGMIRSIPFDYGSGGPSGTIRPFPVTPSKLARFQIDERLLVFVAEMLATREERGLLQALKDNPKDAATRAVYGDWLEENGRPQAAALVRDGWTPGGENA